MATTTLNYCLSCGRGGGCPLISMDQTDRGEQLNALFTKYVCILITKGRICETCEDALHRIDDMVKAFRKKCLETIQRFVMVAKTDQADHADHAEDNVPVQPTTANVANGRKSELQNELTAVQNIYECDKDGEDICNTSAPADSDQGVTHQTSQTSSDPDQGVTHQTSQTSADPDQGVTHQTSQTSSFPSKKLFRKAAPESNRVDRPRWQINICVICSRPGWPLCRQCKEGRVLRSTEKNVNKKGIYVRRPTMKEMCSISKKAKRSASKTDAMTITEQDKCSASKTDAMTITEKRPKFFVPIIEPKLPCGLCGKKFLNSKLVGEHWKVHNEEYGIVELHEDVPDSSSDTLDKPPDMPEGKASKRYKCSSCGTTRSTIRGIRAHVRRLHAGNKQYCCHICGKTVIHQAELNAHMRQHTGEKPYQCSECGNRFTTRNGLRQHHEGVHLKKKPYKCKICSFCFSTISKLKRHEVTHSSERPYLCNTCGKRFKIKSHLNYHAKMHLAAWKSRCPVSMQVPPKVNKKASECSPGSSKTVVEYCCTVCKRSFRSSEKLMNHISVSHEKQCMRCHEVISSYKELAAHNIVCVMQKKTDIADAEDEFEVSDPKEENVEITASASDIVNACTNKQGGSTSAWEVLTDNSTPQLTVSPI